MNGKLERRLATNEDVYREVNDGIVRGQWPGETQSPVGFRCECARLRPGCRSARGLTSRWVVVRVSGATAPMPRGSYRRGAGPVPA
jgi:hypothetical protein